MVINREVDCLLLKGHCAWSHEALQSMEVLTALFLWRMTNCLTVTYLGTHHQLCELMSRTNREVLFKIEAANEALRF